MLELENLHDYGVSNLISDKKFYTRALVEARLRTTVHDNENVLDAFYLTREHEWQGRHWSWRWLTPKPSYKSCRCEFVGQVLRSLRA